MLHCYLTSSRLFEVRSVGRLTILRARIRDEGRTDAKGRIGSDIQSVERDPPSLREIRDERKDSAVSFVRGAAKTEC